MAFGPEKSIKLSMVDSDDGRVSPDSSQDIWKFDCAIGLFLLDNV